MAQPKFYNTNTSQWEPLTVGVAGPQGPQGIQGPAGVDGENSVPITFLPGINPYGGIQYGVPGQTYGGTGTLSTTGGRTFHSIFQAQGGEIVTKVHMSVTVAAPASSLARFGLYEFNPVTGLGGNLIVQSSAVPIDSTGVKTLDLTSDPLYLTPGNFYMSVVLADNAATIAAPLMIPLTYWYGTLNIVTNNWRFYSGFYNTSSNIGAVAGGLASPCDRQPISSPSNLTTTGTTQVLVLEWTRTP